eukprot:2835279-Alexandrium_andersonii.AAC.1
MQYQSTQETGKHCNTGDWQSLHMVGWVEAHRDCKHCCTHQPSRSRSRPISGRRRGCGAASR